MATNKNNPNLTKVISEIANELDILLDSEQLHIGGERAIMRPEKYVLTGIDNKTKKRVVLKCSNISEGISEIKTERKVRKALLDMPFAIQELSIPAELYFGTMHGYSVAVIEFIEQSKVFANYPLREQFFMALHAFESQESFHATTRKHYQSVRSLFSEFTTETYLNDFDMFVSNISKNSHNITAANTAVSAKDFLLKNQSVVSTYNGYLMHSDFVPHNFRIKDRKLFLLDFVAFSFGNKYESWARFINFMEAHSPQLVQPLTEYIKKDRGKDEYLALRIMRMYKIGFLLNFYTNSLSKTDGNLHKLTEERIIFWTHVLDSVLQDIPTEQKMYATYITARDSLRTEKEKRRQREFTNA